MKRIGSLFLLSLILIIINYFLQKIFFDFTSYLNLITILLIYLSLKKSLSNRVLLIFTFFMGIINDSLSFSPLGLSSASLLIMIFFTIKMRENFVFTRIKDRALLGMGAVFFKSLMDILFSSFFEYKISISYLNSLLIKPFISFVILYFIFFFTSKEVEDDI